MDINVVMFFIFIIGILLFLIYAFVHRYVQHYKYSRIEFLLFALLFIVTGGALLLAPILQGSILVQLLGLLLVINGFLIGVFSFLKQNT